MCINIVSNDKVKWIEFILKDKCQQTRGESRNLNGRFWLFRYRVQWARGILQVVLDPPVTYVSDSIKLQNKAEVHDNLPLNQEGFEWNYCRIAKTNYGFDKLLKPAQFASFK